VARHSVRAAGFVLVTAVGVIFAGIGITGSGAAVRAAALPVVTISPNTGLVDLQKVTVAGSGFDANATVASAECRPGATGEADCDLSTVVYGQADQNGAFTQSRYVRRIITIGATTFPPHPTPFDCGAPAGCTLGAGNIANLSQANGQKIFFDPNIPPKVPTITVTPHTNLVDHQLVQVDGTGFSPANTVQVQQCVTNQPAGTFGSCDYATSRYVTIADDGTFHAPKLALERLQFLYTKTGAQTVDCAAAPNICNIQAVSFTLGAPTSVAVPLSFNPNVPPVAAAARVAPATGLHDLQLVTVTGTGFTPGVAVYVEECAHTPALAFPACDYTNTRQVTAAFHGEFNLTFAVHRSVAASEYPTGVINTDCAARTNACDLVVQGTQSQPVQALGISFNPHVRARQLTIAAAPRTMLRDNQPIDALLRGFTPNQPATILECSAEALSGGGNLNYCDATTRQIAAPDPKGAATTTFYVHRVLGGQSGLLDCATRPGTCVLVAFEGEYYYGPTITGTTAVVAAPTSDPTRPNGKPIPPKAAPGSNLPNIAATPLTFTNH